MKGVILAGGTGSRLHPLTKVTNKHLLPIYSKPMIYYPIETMVASGIKDIMLVTGGNAAGEFLRIIGSGSEFGLKHIGYTYQPEPRGIADALSLAEEWVCGEPICVMLGDNVLENPIKEAVDEFQADPVGAKIFLTKVTNPQHYGVVEVDENGYITGIEEKPAMPKTNLIAVGVYMYDSNVWELIAGLTPSKRNELEITDLNNMYLQKGLLKSSMLKGQWMDCGESIDGYFAANTMMFTIQQNRKYVQDLQHFTGV